MKRQQTCRGWPSSGTICASPKPCCPGLFTESVGRAKAVLALLPLPLGRPGRWAGSVPLYCGLSGSGSREPRLALGHRFKESSPGRSSCCPASMAAGQAGSVAGHNNARPLGRLHGARTCDLSSPSPSTRPLIAKSFDEQDEASLRGDRKREISSPDDPAGVPPGTSTQKRTWQSGGGHRTLRNHAGYGYEGVTLCSHREGAPVRRLGRHPGATECPQRGSCTDPAQRKH